jgi:VWFA-related protein
MKRICQTTLLALLVFCAAAQPPEDAKVAIPIIASDSHHLPTNLTVESLVVTDQQLPVSGASLLRGSDLPLELGVLIDTSSSQRYVHLDEILKETKQFVDEIIRGPEDRVFFLNFSDEQKATPWLNKEQLKTTSVKVSTVGGTAIYDAIVMACKKRMGPRDWRKPTRRVLLLITDGEDNESHITRNDAVLEALKAGAVILAINTESGNVSTGQKFLLNLAQSAGGEVFSQIGRQQVAKVFALLHELLENMYYLSYVPPASKSAVHEIDLRFTGQQSVDLSYARKYFWNP